MFKLCVLVVIALAATAAEAGKCPETATLWPVEDDCRSYYVCGTEPEKVEKCFPLIRKFSRETLKCEWAWKVDCTLKPVPPTRVTSDVESCLPQSPRRRKLTPFPDVGQVTGPSYRPAVQ